MSNKIADRRVQKTRRLLHEALISLTLEKNYESIIVQDILDRANVGRSTFYMHFRDKDELLIMGFGALREGLQEAQKATSLSSADAVEKSIAFSLSMFEHVYEYRLVWQALTGSYAGVIVRQQMLEMISELIESQLTSELQKRKKTGSRVPLELFIHYLASTFISVVSWWLEAQKPLAPRSINDIYRALVTPSLKSMFD